MNIRPTLLDRYVAREIVPPTSIGLLLFTFIILLKDIPHLLETMIARSADLSTILTVFGNLLPSILAVTIPMAFLLGVLLAFGRMATDSEIVALRGSGVSPLFLLRPVIALALATGLVTFYVMAVAVPRANQSFRETMYDLILSKARSDVKPRVFTDELLPGRTMLLYVSDIASETGEWKDVFVHDLRDGKKPQVILARSGGLAVDREGKRVQLHLRDGWIHASDPATPASFTRTRFQEDLFLPLSFEELFPRVPLAKGDRELTLSELSVHIRELRRQKSRDIARFEVEWHKKFSIPTACLVFGLLGLGLSLGSKKEARSAAFGLSIAVIFVYYVIIRLGEQAGDTGLIAPFPAMWGANILLGGIGAALLALNQREAAFDPLDPSHYTLWLPHVRRHKAARPVAASPGRGPRPVVVLRVPRVGFPTPGILDRYIARAFVSHLFLVLAAFCSLYILIEMTDLLDDVRTNRVKGAVVLHYYLFFSPAIAHLMLPVAVLVGVLITFGVLSRSNELTAMKASGISLYRAVLPTLAMAVVGSLTLFTLGEYIMPRANRIARQDFNTIKGRPSQSSVYLEKRWILGGDGRFYNYDVLDEGRPGIGVSLYGLSVYDVDARTWSLRDHIFASRAVWDDNTGLYTFERGWRRTFLGDKATLRVMENIRTREIEPPSYFKRAQPESDTLRFGELKGYISSLEALGLDVTRLRVQLNKKLAFPLVTVVMTLIGIPFAFVVARRGALYGIGISIVVAIVYWACLGIFEALGNNALLPATLAAWAPNLLFGAAGLYLMFNLET